MPAADAAGERGLLRAVGGPIPDGFDFQDRYEDQIIERFGRRRNRRPLNAIYNRLIDMIVDKVMGTDDEIPDEYLPQQARVSQFKESKQSEQSK